MYPYMKIVDKCLTNLPKVHRKSMRIARKEAKLLAILRDLINSTPTRKKSHSPVLDGPPRAGTRQQPKERKPHVVVVAMKKWPLWMS